MASRVASSVLEGHCIPRVTFPAKKARAQIHDHFLRKLKSAGTKFLWQRNGKIKRQRPLKKVSRALRTRLQHYYPLQQEFLRQPGNENCVICQVRREHGENIPLNAATEVHHFRGRRGRLLCWVPGFRPSCYFCRDWPGDNKKKAREWGLLAPTTVYDVFPG